MVDVGQRAAHEFLEHPRGVLVAGLAGIDRDQVMHGHDEAGGEPALEREDTVEIVLVNPGRPQGARDGWITVIEHPGPVERLRRVALRSGPRPLGRLPAAALGQKHVPSKLIRNPVGIAAHRLIFALKHRKITEVCKTTPPIIMDSTMLDCTRWIPVKLGCCPI